MPANPCLPCHVRYCRSPPLSKHDNGSPSYNSSKPPTAGGSKKKPMWTTSLIKDSNPNMSVVGPPGGTPTTDKDEPGNYWSHSPEKPPVHLPHPHRPHTSRHHQLLGRWRQRTPEKPRQNTPRTTPRTPTHHYRLVACTAHQHPTRSDGHRQKTKVG